MCRRTIGVLAALSACQPPAEAPIAVADVLDSGVLHTGAPVVVDGTASVDPSGRGLTYGWALIARPPGSLTSVDAPNREMTSFVPDVYGEFVVRLVVSDGLLTSAPATATVSVDACGSEAPIISDLAVSPASPRLGNALRLSATVEDADNGAGCALDQSLSYTWTVAARPAGALAALTNPGSATPALVPDRSGLWAVELVVTDEAGLASVPGELSIEVSECGGATPVITDIAVAPESPSVGDPVAIEIEASDADATDCGLPDSVDLASSFSARPPGSFAVLAPEVGATIGFVADVPGTYAVRTVATDRTGRSSERITEILVSVCGDADPEIESSFSPASPIQGDRVVLDITLSDPDEDCGIEQDLAAHHAFVAQPAGSMAVLAPSVGLSPSFDADLAGRYVVRTTAVDGTGRFAERDTSVDVGACGGAAPDVDLVAPSFASVGELVALNVDATDADVDECGLDQKLLVQSALVGQPGGSVAALSPSRGRTPAFVPDVPGTYVVRTLVTDDTGRMGTDEETIEVDDCGAADPALTVVATGSLLVGDSVTLDVEATDADNDLCDLGQTLDVVSELVGLPAGSAASLTPAAGTSPSFLPDRPGTYVVRTTVTDETGRSTSMDTTVVIDGCGGQAPVVVDVAVSPDPASVGTLVSLAVVVSDADVDDCGLAETLDVSTSFRDVPAGSGAALEPALGLTPGFVPDVPGTYVLAVEVADGSGKTDLVLVEVVVEECGDSPPSIDAVVPDPAADVDSGEPVTLWITTSDPDVGCGGLVETLESSFVTRPGGSTAALLPAIGWAPTFVPDRPGTYIVRTTVTDDSGRSSFVDTVVTAGACGLQPPAIDGVDVAPETPIAGDRVELAVTVSDADTTDCLRTDPLTVTTAFVARPPGSAAVLEPAEGPTPSFVADLPGTYTLRVAVVDEAGHEDSTLVDIEVDPCRSAAPVFDSVTQSPVAPVTGDLVTLDLDVSDADVDTCLLADTLTVVSELVSLPAGSAATLLPSVGFTPAFVADVPGSYAIRSVATDGNGHSSNTVTVVVVDACGSAVPHIDDVDAPVAPIVGETVTLALTVSDADVDACLLPQALTVSSELVGQPPGSTATLAPSAGTSPTFTADLPGTYVVRSTITDGTGRSASTDTVVVVDACGSAVPQIDDADAPESPRVGDVVTLALTASDPDVDDCGLAQTLVLTSVLVSQPGGSSATLLSSAGPEPTFVPDVAGTYVVRTTVTDSTGKSSTIDTAIEVDACGGADPSIDDVTVSPLAPRTDELVSLDVDASDADIDDCGLDQTLTTTSFLVSVPPGSAATLLSSTGDAPAFVADRPGSYSIRTVVVDGTGRSDATTTTVVVDDCGSASPSVDAFTGPADPDTWDLVVLAISVSDDDNDVCAMGQVLTVTTSFTERPAGSSATLAPSSGTTPAFVADVPGIYRLQALVEDGTGRSATAALRVDVDECGSEPPDALVAMLSPFTEGPDDALVVVDQVAVDDPVWLDASDSSDPDIDDGCSSGLSFSWRATELPAGGTEDINNTSIVDPTVTPHHVGFYTFEVTVTDETGLTDTATVTFEAVPGVVLDLAPGFTSEFVDGENPFWDSPQGIAVNALGDVFVAMEGNETIYRLGDDAAFASSALLSGVEDIVYVLAVDAFFATTDFGIVKISSTGTVTLWSVDVDTPQGIALAPDGSLAVADRGTDELLFFDPTDAPLASSNRSNDMDGDLNNPWGVAADFVFDYATHDGDSLFQSDDGDPPNVFVDGDLDNPRDLLRTPSGDLIVADTDNHRILLVDNCGGDDCSFTVLAEAPNEDWHPFGLAFEDPTTLLVTDRNAGTMYRITGLFP